MIARMLVIAVAWGTTAASAQAPPTERGAEINAVGEATLETPATRVFVWLWTASYGRTLEEASAQTELRMQRIMRTLQPIGITADSITSRRYSGRTVGEEVLPDSVFVSTHDLRLATHRLDLLKAIIEPIVTLGEYRVEQIWFVSGARDSVYLRAVAEASAMARARAEAMAAVAGGRLGDLLFLDSSPTRAPSLLDTMHLGCPVPVHVVLTESAVPWQAPPIMVEATVKGRWRLVTLP